MLKLKSDWLDYRELLSPPPEYKVEFAVGTTYSLDLETLMATCAIIGLNVEPDIDLVKKPFHMLSVMRKASAEQLLLFCQRGQIKRPGKQNKLFPLLENCVCEVSMKNKKSFHPKTWFVRYSSVNGRRGDELPDIYRLVVLSRNLTFDRSWDVALRLDSSTKPSEKKIKCERSTGISIHDFLIWLSRHADFRGQTLKDKRGYLTELAKELMNVKWKSIGREFEKFDFIPYGIYDNSDGATGIFSDTTFHKMFVISPFVNKSVINGFAEKRLNNPDCTLITRKPELPKLGADLLTKFDTYIVKTEVMFGEERISEYNTVKDDTADGEESISESGENKNHDIHAKVYMRTKNGEGSELYIGSANATDNAFNGNVECLLKLSGQPKNLNVGSLKKDLGLDNPKDKSCPFVYVKPEDYPVQQEDAEGQNLDAAIKEFYASEMSAAVSGENTFTVTVTLKLPKSSVSLSLSPLMRDNPKPLSETLVFDGFVLRELSEWYIVTAKEGEQKPVCRVIKIPTTGIPTKERDSAIFRDIVKNLDSYLEYAVFYLSDDYIGEFLEYERRKSGSRDSNSHNMSCAPGLYELMLKAAANYPDRLREVRESIKLLTNEEFDSSEELTKFVKFCEEFEKAGGYDGKKT
jgi:HKD family nuclease